MKHAAFLPLVLLALSIGCSQAQESTPTSGQNAEQAQLSDLDPTAFQKRIADGDAQLIDVRTAEEFAGGHIAGATNLDWNSGDPKKTYAGLEKSKPVLVYCAAGGRSTKAMHHLQQEGFSVQQLDNGIAAWEKDGLPVVKE